MKKRVERWRLWRKTTELGERVCLQLLNISNVLDARACVHWVCGGLEAIFWLATGSARTLGISVAGVALAIAPFVPKAVSQSVLAEDNVAGGVSKPAIKIPEKPADPRAANAYRVLDRHCACCHQAGRTKEPLHSDGIANILDLDSIARDRGLVHPGLPDASRLYDVLVTRHAPLEVFGRGDSKTEPTPDEIGLVRQWIKDLPSGLQQCPDRRPVGEDKIFDVVREAQAMKDCNDRVDKPVKP